MENMSRFFYGKLAFSNLKKNARLYLPYMLTAIGVSAMYYIMLAITKDEGIQKMPGSESLQMVLGLGCGVITIFAVIFLFYTNSFLMKRRKKEFGLFNILGMEKRHIGKMMFWETGMIAIVCIIGGAITGIILYKLVVLILLRITGLEVPFGFYISFSAVKSMVICFLCIFAVTLFYNLFQVRKAKPIELLQSSNQGEAEPKTRWLMSLIGILALGVGYAIAIVVEDPIGALLMFFVAVILVMIGTYCLFVAGSVAILKLMRKNKKYFYRTKHFISVSGMIYRMKQNAVGLANICILSTMVLVMIAGTVSLYAGVEDVINKRYPKDITMTGYRNMTDKQIADLNGILEQAVNETGLSIEDKTEYTSLAVTIIKNGENMQIVNINSTMPEGKMVMTEFITLEEYNQITKQQQELKEDEILVYVMRGKEGEQNYHINEKTFHIKEYLKDFDMEGLDTNLVYDIYFIIVKDKTVLSEIDSMQQEVFGEQASNFTHYMYADISGTAQEIQDCTNRVGELIEVYNQGHNEEECMIVRVENREENKEDFLIFCGGFLFLGVFLGFVFLMATVLIIYYKQISEGYEDKTRFAIMQKVGMSPKEVKSSIRSQVLKVFFLPLIMACIHLAMAFPMMNRLILLFGMSNVGLFAICTIITIGVFTVIYGIVYGMTARTYYRIVGES